MALFKGQENGGGAKVAETKADIASQQYQNGKELARKLVKSLTCNINVKYAKKQASKGKEFVLRRWR